MRVLAVLVALLFVGTSAASSVQAPLVVTALDPVLRLDSDGGRTFIAVLEDGLDGLYGYVPFSDATLAAHTNALALAGVEVDPIVYSGALEEVGVFTHAFVLGGSPYLTLGTYVRTTDAGLVRFPVVMLENVTDVGGVTRLLSSVFGDELMPVVGEAIPHAYSLVAPDAGPLVMLLAPTIVLVALAPIIALGLVVGADASTPLVNGPSDVYSMIQTMGVDAFLLVFPLLFGPEGYPSPAGSFDPWSDDYAERPDVHVWTVHKSGAGRDVWQGTYLARSGSSNGGTVDAFSGTKRLESGVATRVDGALVHVAGVYLQTDVERTGSPTSVDTYVRYTAGATAADAADVPLAAIEMEQSRADPDGRVGLYPRSQQEDWRVGAFVGGGFVPLLGARTDSTHRVFTDATNGGDPVPATETDRTTSVGVYAQGAYVPLVGARYWGERQPAEVWPLAFAGGGGLGDQLAGDLEVSVGAFVQSAYAPVAGLRVDDDFVHHLHEHRTLLSAGTYLQGVYQPVVGTTYDGARAFTPWLEAFQAGDGDADAPWQTSVGTFTLGFYRPVFGTRYAPESHAAERAQQESYQIGVYPLNYDPFIPLLSVDYDGDDSSAVWAVPFAAGVAGNGREGDWDLDVVAYTPGPFVFPLAGVQYRTDAPDQNGVYDTHVVVGAYQGAAFTPLVGATLSADDSPLRVVTAGGAAAVRVSVGHFVGGSYSPVTTLSVGNPF